MLRSQKVLNSSQQILRPLLTPAPTIPPQLQNLPNSPPLWLPNLKQTCKLSRRDLTVCGNSLLLLILGTSVIEPFDLSKVRAEESPDINKNEGQENLNDGGSVKCIDEIPGKRAFLDISINGESAGRIVIGLYGDSTPAGAARFSSLVSGTAGISYRRKEFIKIKPNYVQHGGVRSYGLDAELANRTGSNLVVENLIQEWERNSENCPGTKNLAGTVSIIVKDPLKPPPKMKLVARQGKLEIDKEEVGKDPNGTEFVIATKDSPELDASALVIGRVLEGMEVVKKIGQVKTVQENTSSPYFRVAKLIGDKRAVVAERGFNRPYSKVLVTNCGLLE